MLTPSQFRHWCQQLQLPASTCEYLAAQRVAPPSRVVQGRAHNVTGRYPSHKMGVVMQFESHTVELWALYLLDHDPEVLEFYEQPAPIQLRYQAASGRTTAPYHTPDFLVLRRHSVGWEEWKPEARLRTLASRQSQRYQQTESGTWRCPPGEAAAARLGLSYRVRSSAECSPIYIQNLDFLADYFRFPVVVPSAQAATILGEVAREPGITLATLLSRAPELRANEVYALIAEARLWVDLAAAPLVAHRQVQLYPDQATAEARRLVTASVNRGPLVPLTSPPASALRVNTQLDWDGRLWTLVNLGETTTTLLPDVGPPMQVPTSSFFALLETRAITLPTGTDPAPERLEVQHLLKEASPAALAEANRRFHLVHAYLQRKPEQYAEVPVRTLRHWTKQFRAAQVCYGCGYVGLLPQIAARGNRTPKAPEASRALLDTMIQAHFETPRRMPAWEVYLLYQQACQDQHLTSLSASTFYRRIKQRASPEQTAKRRGARAAYAETPWYWELTRTTPRHGDRPFAVAHLDHTELDIELVSSATGKRLGRPWATFLVDAHSRRLLAIYLSFDPPSYRSCMMAWRLCVRQHGRLPQTLVVDGGKEFQSVYFDTLLARYHCIKKIRPGARPRFGSVVERLFGTANTQLIHTLLGNTQAKTTPRELTRAVDPKRQAVWTLGELSEVLWRWATEVYDQTEHPSLGQSPRQAFLTGLAQGGEREHRQIPYDEEFLLWTLPSTLKGTAKVLPGQGFKLHHLYYWHQDLRHPEVERTQVPVRYDPFDIGVAYAYVQGRWVRCISEYSPTFQGHSERELLLASAELLQAAKRTKTTASLSASRLAAFLKDVQAHEAVLLQRLRDLEARSVLDRLASAPHLALVGEGTRSPAPMFAFDQEAPVDLERLPRFKEYQ